MAIHGFDIAVGMSPEAFSKRAHIFTVAAQYVLSKDEIDAILHDWELDSYDELFVYLRLCAGVRLGNVIHFST